MFNVGDVRISLASRASDRMRLESGTHVLLVIVIFYSCSNDLEYFNVSQRCDVRISLASRASDRMRLNRHARAPSYSDFYSARNDLEYSQCFQRSDVRISLASRASDRYEIESARRCP